MDDDNWSVVGKPKKVKSGENKTVNGVSEQEEENLKLLTSMLKTNGSMKKDTEQMKKSQIPTKVKPKVTENKPQKVAKKKSESPAAETFRSLQAGLNALNITELKDLLEATRIQFNNDVIMLKTVLTFLNEKLRLEKPEDSLVFEKLDYPHTILPSALKTIIKPLIEKCSNENLQYLFHNLLQSLCEELNKGRNFVGHLFMLQQLAFYCPEVCISNLASTVILRNSYQNQPNICLSLFWALSASGLVDTTVGLRVWVDIVSSVMNVKSYTKYCFDFLQKILAASAKTPKLKISQDEFKSLVELLLSNVQKVKSKELQRAKENCVEMLVEKFVKGTDQVDSSFLMLLNFSKRSPELFVRGVIESIELHPEECLNVWRLNFQNYSRPNVFIFSYLDNNIKETENLAGNKLFIKFIKQIDYESNPNLSFAKDIPAKMTDNKKQKKQKNGTQSSGCSSCCKWFFGSFVLFSAIAGLIAYDTNVLHDGKFEESSVGRVLKQTGALPHVENAWFVSLKFSAKGYKWAEKEAPVAYEKTRIFMQPYCEFAKDLGLTLINSGKKGWESTKVFVAEKTPVVIAFIDKYVPGLGQKIHDFTVNTFKGLCSLTCNGWKQSTEFFKTRVFVGQLSPENLGKAFNSTTQRALTYYSWFHEKVDFYAKIN